MMKNVRRISNKYYLRQIMSCWLMCYMLFCFGIPVRVAMATPNGGEFQVGTGTIADGVQNSTVLVNQMESIIHWNGLDTSSSESLSFSQMEGLSNAAVLNRVVGEGALSATQFNGALNGQNMRIFIVNPAGIIFGKNAVINVSQLVASSLKLDDADFLDGAPYNFYDGLAAGDVTFKANADNVTAERLYLIGKNVINNGGLVAGDYVVMAAGDRVLISESGSNVAVDVLMPSTPDGWTPDDFKVRNFDVSHDGVEAKVESEHIILAAGDIYSAAFVKAYSDGGSDAVATVEIKAVGGVGADVDIKDDVTAEAVGYGDGTNNAIARITITAGGALTIESDGSSGTELVAEASDGVNNSAEISLTAAGAFTIDAPDLVTVQAEAGAGKAEALLNQANVNIAGGSVLIKATDKGRTDAPATIYAYAHDAVENQAGVDIQSAGDVEIIGAGENGDKAIIKAEAQSGTVNNAQITINAAGDVDIIAENADAQVLAYAHDGEDNTANVDITASGDVTVKSEGGNYDHEDGFTPYVASVEADAENALNSNTAGVDITAGGDVVVLSKDGGEAKVLAYAGNALASQNTATVNLTAQDGYVLVHAIEGYYDHHLEEFIPSEASIEATAEYAGDEVEITGSTNSANITIVANDIPNEEEEEGFGDGDVGVIAVNGGKAEVEAIAKDGDENTAGVSVTADGDVVVIAECEGQPSEAEIMALAKDAHVSNTALVNITAGGDVEVLSENGGKAEITAIAKDGPTNQADVDITAGGEVIVKAEGGLIDEWTVTVHDSYDVHIKHWLETEAEHWHWKFHKNSGTSGPTYTYIKTFVNVQPGNPSGYHYDSVDPDEAEGYYDQDIWLTGVDSKTPVLAAIGYAGWEYADDYSHPDHDSNPYWSENTHDELHTSFETPSVASIKAIAEDDLSSNTANVNINAGDDVKVMAFDGGIAEVIAETELGELNTSDITINSSGDVKVLAIGNTETTDSPKATSDALIKAKAEDGLENTATVGINAVGGDVLVLGTERGEAAIKATAEDAENSNTADVTINATATTSEYLYKGDEQVYLEVDGGDVKVIAVEGGEAAITALAKDAGGERTNTANVTINATAAEGTMQGEMVTEAVYDTEEPYDLLEAAVYEAVSYTEGGDVKVIGTKGGEAEIEALAIDGVTNVADVLICIDGGVKVEGDKGGKAEIEALAKGNDATTNNTATVGIGAKGDKGVEVIADRGGEAGISSKAKNGETNTASTIVCTGGGVDVKALRGGDAEILAQAKYGLYNDAYVGIGAMGDVVVQTGEMPDIVGCDAVIRAEAEMGIQIQQDPDEEPLITTADAEVVVFSHVGNVEVLAYNHGHSGIEAEAQGAHLNTAKVGVAAGADLSPADVALPPVEFTLFTIDGFGPLPLSGNVIVEASGDSKAQILAYAHDAYPIYVEVPVVGGEPQIVTVPGENTANTVICAPGEVRVSADKGSEAKIKSMAGQWWDEPSEFIINSATTQVYASEVKVDVPDRRGNGISALADGIMVNVPDNDVEVDDGRLTYCLTEDGAGAWTDGGSTLIVDTYANRKDCPTCPPCPCEGQQPVPPPPPPAPLSAMQFSNITERVPEISGCPGIVAAATAELGITPENIQVAMGNSMASATDIQPCDTCARLVIAAAILKDADGSRLAALLEAINAIAPANVPFTPEIGAQIATVFEGHKGDGTAYASALEYVDAFVQYVKILDNEMGSPVGDSVAFALEKHGQTLTASDNANVAAFVASRLEQTTR